MQSGGLPDLDTKTLLLSFTFGCSCWGQIVATQNLGQQFFDDMAVHIREPEVPALILVGETFVVYT